MNGIIVRVLVVEDDVHMRTAFDRYLKSAGYEVSMAFNAEAALTLLTHERAFDVVLLDIKLDGQSGWAVAGFMQAHERHRQTPIIVISGLEPEEIRQGAFAYAHLLARAAIIMSKPVDGDRLLDMIERVTGKGLIK